MKQEFVDAANRLRRFAAGEEVYADTGHGLFHDRRTLADAFLELGALAFAAPDLLAACKLWDQGFTEGQQFDEREFLEWVNKNRAAARAAIARATGELP